MAEQRFAVVVDDLVVNVVIWDPVAAPEWAPDEGHAVACDSEVGIGWRYQAGGFIPDEAVA
jgi:hypothetical protein